MISVVAYGRNDAHGYNLHRRAALSLNCIAEVLGPDDEILFTDYNTPDPLPTLPEALNDTLTSRCRERLRVLRVRPEMHIAAHRGRPASTVVESLARNVAIRRSNPSNRWVLLTNTDMILVPRGSETLSGAVASLPDAFYTIPRYELPEWVWEQLPRSDPAHVLREIPRLGPTLRLTETTTSHDWLRFDCAGDFQLVLRDDLLAIDGLDERMALGWHVDANLGRRMLLRRGAIESLAEEVSGYHCNHTRTTTILQRRDAMNDYARFVVNLREAAAPAQRDRWGLPDADIEELRLAHDARDSFRAAVSTAIGAATTPLRPTDARNEKWRLEYDSGHVMAFLADLLSVAPPRSRVAYLGVNETLEEMLRGTLETLQWPELQPLEANLRGEDLRQATLVVVDLGIDARCVGEPLSRSSSPAASACRRKLSTTFETFRELVAHERRALLGGAYPRTFGLVNSSAVYWNAFSVANLDFGPTTPHAVVRRATAKITPVRDRAARTAGRRARQLWRWVSRGDGGVALLTLRPERRIDLALVDAYAGFASGWSLPDRKGLPTDGAIAEAAFNLDCDTQGPVELELAFDCFPIVRAAPRAMSAAGQPLESTVVRTREDAITWRLRLLPHHIVRGEARITLEHSASGCRLRSIVLRGSAGRRVVQLARSAVHSSFGRITPRH